MSTRPQRPVSPDAQKAIAEGLDEGAREATAMGYPSTGKALERKAADYRAATGQTESGQQPSS